MRLESQKGHRKSFKSKKRNMGRVLNVKPYPIPDLEGESARIFEQQIREPPTEAQKRMIREGAIVFAKTKRK
jgi:hypothetical protein